VRRVIGPNPERASEAARRWYAARRPEKRHRGAWTIAVAPPRDLLPEVQDGEPHVEVAQEPPGPPPQSIHDHGVHHGHDPHLGERPGQDASVSDRELELPVGLLARLRLRPTARSQFR
jgi:hypothetical protein